MSKKELSRPARERAEDWHARLDAAEAEWEKREHLRVELREMLGDELTFPLVMYGPPGQAEANRQANPGIDQIDLNLALRYANKVRSLVGDEEPEVRASRDWRGWERVGYLWDRLVMRILAQTGAPGEVSDGSAATCSEGVTTYWVGYAAPFLTATDVQAMAKGTGARVRDAAMGAATSTDADDHQTMASVMVKQAFSKEAVVDDPSGSIGMNLIRAAGEHLEDAEEDYKEGLNWRVDRHRIVVYRVPYGSHALSDCVTSIRQARWVAEKITMDLEEAKATEAFRLSWRNKLVADSFDEKDEYSKDNLKTVLPHSVDEQVSFWRIWDRKYEKVHIIHRDIPEYGEVDDSYPFVDERGRPLITPLAGHPGFFPLVLSVPQRSVEDGPQKLLGIPLLLPGLKILKSLAKCVSHYNNTVKRAATAQYLVSNQMEDAVLKAIEQNVDGSVHKAPPNVEPDKAVAAIGWKHPSPELFMLIDRLVDQWCIVQSFPKMELTTQPQSRTATQDQMAMQGGDLWMGEVIRSFQVDYALIAHIVGRLATFLPDESWAELIGAQEAQVLRKSLLTFGMPEDLPKVRFASNERDRDPVRIKQLLDFHERARQEVNVLGLPEWDTKHILDEASRSMGMGPLVAKQYSEEEIRAILMQKMAQGPGGTPGSEGSAPPGERSSAGQRRDRPRNRGGRRGRSTTGQRNGPVRAAARDTGPL